MISQSFLDFVCLAAFLFPFYADELITMVVRLKDGESLLKPHRRDFYQILANEMGIAHWKISISNGLFQLTVGLSVLWIMPSGPVPVLFLLAFYFVVFALFGHSVRKSVAALNR